jgi:hypothetical protein
VKVEDIVVWTCFLHGHNKVTPLRVPKINILNRPKRRQRNPVTEDIKHNVGKRLRHRTGRRALRETRHKCRSVHKDYNPDANDKGRLLLLLLLLYTDSKILLIPIACDQTGAEYLIIRWYLHWPKFLQGTLCSCSNTWAIQLIRGYAIWISLLSAG